MSELTRIVRWPGSPDEIPEPAVPFALDDAGHLQSVPRVPRGAAVGVAIAAMLLFADQTQLPAPPSPSSGTASFRDRIRIVSWGQGDELPATAATAALDDDFGEPTRPQQAERSTVVVWVGGGEDSIPNLVEDDAWQPLEPSKPSVARLLSFDHDDAVPIAPVALVEFEQDWAPKAGPWPAPVLRIEIDPAEGVPAAVASLLFDEDNWQPLRAFMLPPALLAAHDPADAPSQPLPFEDYWHRELFIAPQPEARIWGAEDEIATPPPALLFDDGYRIESFTVVLAGGLHVAQTVIGGAIDVLAMAAADPSVLSAPPIGHGLVMGRRTTPTLGRRRANLSTRTR